MHEVNNDLMILLMQNKQIHQTEIETNTPISRKRHQQISLLMPILDAIFFVCCLFNMITKSMWSNSILIVVSTCFSLVERWTNPKTEWGFWSILDWWETRQEMFSHLKIHTRTLPVAPGSLLTEKRPGCQSVRVYLHLSELGIPLK